MTAEERKAARLKGMAARKEREDAKRLELSDLPPTAADDGAGGDPDGGADAGPDGLAVVIAPGAAERRKRLLGGLELERAALVTDEDLEKIEAEEREKALAEQKKQALADVRAAARQIARVEHDLIAASVLRSDDERRRLAEPVTFRVRLPGDGAGHRGQNGFRVDGFLYQDGQTYTRPRAIFESLQANHYRAWLSEIQFKTLDQHKLGGSAVEVLAQTLPHFEVSHAG